MIKFFRNIRQRLLSDVKTSKYLLYAIGEIILVVIEILIAIQVNTWNESLKELVKEKRFLSELSLDLTSDSLFIAESIDISNNQIRTKNYLAQYFHGEYFSSDSLITYFKPQFYSRYNFSAITTSFDEI